MKGRSGCAGRRAKTILSLAIAAGIGAACFLFFAPSGRGVIDTLMDGGTAMAGRTANGATQRPREIPAIDLARPGATETATFAMG